MPALLALVLLSTAAQGERTVRLATVNRLANLPTFIADAAGIFRQQGLAVTLITAGSSADALARLRSGEATFALMSLTPLTRDLLTDPTPAQPDDPVIIANLVRSSRLQRIVTPADSDIREPADLVDRRIGLPRGTNAGFAWWVYSRVHTLPSDAVATLVAPVERLIEALGNGRIDAAVLHEPWASRAADTLPAGGRDLTRHGLPTARWVLVTRRAIADQATGPAPGLLRAYRQACKSIADNPDGARTLFARHTGLAKEALEHTADTLGYDVGIDWALITALQLKLDWAARRRGRTRPTATGPGVLGLIDTSPLRAVAPRAVGVPVTARAAGNR